MSRQPRRLGRRRETRILLPAALLLLIALSTYTLLTHQQALRALTEQRRSEAVHSASRLAELLSSGALPNAEALRRLIPPSARLAVVDRGGRGVAQVGLFEQEDLLTAAGDADLEVPLAVGPGPVAPDRIVAFAPLRWRGERHYLRLDLDAAVLAGQLRSQRILLVVVLGANLAVVLLVVLFLQHLLAPWETMLERARQMGPGAESEEEDEAAFLMSAFERALGVLASGGDADADISALERALGPSLESGLLLLERHGRVLALNRTGAELLGVEPPASRVPVAELLSAHPPLVERIGAAVAQEAAVQRAEIEIAVGGLPRTLGLTAHPLRRDDDTLRGHLILFVDLTEISRRAEEQRLASSLAQVGELAAGVAHEMRNSLATLKGYLTLIDREPEQEALTDYLQEIRRESDHLQRVLEDFLSFARPGSTRMEEVDVVDLVRRAAADPALEGVGVTLSDLERGAAPIHGDPQLLERAVRNLLRNAAEAHRRAAVGRPIEVSLRRSADGLEIVVEDCGAGIPPEIRGRIFEPFVSAESGGTGLGLALAHRIVALHAGSLAVEDRAEGGTRARLALRVGKTVTHGN